MPSRYVSVKTRAAARQRDKKWREELKTDPLAYEARLFKQMNYARNKRAKLKNQKIEEAAQRMYDVYYKGEYRFDQASEIARERFKAMAFTALYPT